MEEVVGGCGKENMSLNTGECSARMPLKTRNSTSRATRMMLPSSYQNSSSRFLEETSTFPGSGVAPSLEAAAIVPVRARFRVPRVDIVLLI